MRRVIVTFAALGIISSPLLAGCTELFETKPKPPRIDTAELVAKEKEKQAKEAAEAAQPGTPAGGNSGENGNEAGGDGSGNGRGDGGGDGSGDGSGTQVKGHPIPDKYGLIPTDHPGIYIATKPVPKPETAPTVEAPDLHEGQNQQTYTGAINTTIHLEALRIYGYTSGDPQPFADLCNQADPWCAAQTAEIKRVADGRSWYVYTGAPGMDIDNMLLLHADPYATQQQVGFNIDPPTHLHFDADTMRFENLRPSRVYRKVQLSYVGGKWAVDSVQEF